MREHEREKDNFIDKSPALGGSLVKEGAKKTGRIAAGWLVFLCILLPGTVAAVSQQSMTLEEAGQRGATLFAESGFTGMVLVVVRNREMAIRSYGETFPGSGRLPDSKSVIRLCSLSKIVTTDLLSKMVLEGKVRLADPLDRYAPKGKVVPRKGKDGRITLQDLATHTSGLPREVGSYPPHTAHFTFPDQSFRWNWLQKQKLISTPGTEALYSNVGFDLLGDALAVAAGKPYAQLLDERFVRPLRLQETMLTPNADQCARLLRGANDEGPCTDTQASGPSGGVYTTAGDMGRVLQYLLHIPGYPVQPDSALAVVFKPQQLKSVQGLDHAGDPTGIGLGWVQLGDPNSPQAVMEKTGGGAGFSTYIVLSRKKQTGVFVAVTEGKGPWHIDLFGEANNLLADLAGIPPLPARVHKTRPAKKRNARPSHRKKAANS